MTDDNKEIPMPTKAEEKPVAELVNLTINDIHYCKKIIEIAVEKGTMILNAGLEVVTATSAGTSTCDLGTGVDADAFVDGFNSASGTAAGTLSQNPAAFQPIMCVANDNIDLTLATQSGTAMTTGKLRIWAVLMDCTDIGDMAANEVARDNA